MARRVTNSDLVVDNLFLCIYDTDDDGDEYSWEGIVSIITDIKSEHDGCNKYIVAEMSTESNGTLSSIRLAGMNGEESYSSDGQEYMKLVPCDSVSEEELFYIEMSGDYRGIEVKDS